MYVVSRKHGIVPIRLNVVGECRQKTYKLTVFSTERKYLI